MNDQDIQVFITCARRYFEALETNPSLVIEPPFLRVQPGPFLELTGIIRVTGNFRGAICFTAGRTMLQNMLQQLKDGRQDDEAVKDLVGEIANTLSGNAREVFGSEFKISVPVIAFGNHLPYTFEERAHNYAIPLSWRAQTAYLLVSLH